MPALLVLAAVAVLVSLGNWQMRRLAWREALIARVAERIEAEPLDLRGEGLSALGDPGVFLAENEYRSILLEGEYVRADEVLVFTTLSDPKGPFSGPGFWVMTPFAEPTGAIVYVNRGFVPEQKRNDYTTPPDGQISIHGLVRAAEKGSWLTPAPDIEKRVFYARDPVKFAPAANAKQTVSDFTIDLAASETPPGGLPQAGETRTVFPNNHLQYAITWYGLAAALLAVFGAFVMSRRGPTPGPSA